MSELKLNEMEQVSGGVEVVQPITEADVRQAAIGFKNQGYDTAIIPSMMSWKACRNTAPNTGMNSFQRIWRRRINLARGLWRKQRRRRHEAQG